MSEDIIKKLQNINEWIRLNNEIYKLNIYQIKIK